MKKGLIIGKGWLGSKIEKKLNQSFSFTTTKRKSDAENCLEIDFDQAINSSINSDDYDFIIITIPFGKRNSEEELMNRFTHLISFLNHYNKQLTLISSTGIYPEIEAIIDENYFSDAELIEPYISIENLMKNNFPQLNILRLGGLMGDDRYLSKYINFSNHNLDTVANHIHYKDVIKVINQIIENNISSSIFNVVAPIHPTKLEILDVEINNKQQSAEDRKGKTISSEKLINKLNYDFIYPNPIYFKD